MKSKSILCIIMTGVMTLSTVNPAGIFAESVPPFELEDGTGDSGSLQFDSLLEDGDEFGTDQDTVVVDSYYDDADEDTLEGTDYFDSIFEDEFDETLTEEDAEGLLVSRGTMLSVTKQPEDIVYPVGATASMTVEAEGEGLTYQWYYQRVGATKWTAWTGKTAANLTFKVYDSYDGMKLYCKVKDGTGVTVDSDYATLTIGTPITITQQPEDIVYPTGATASMTVAAEGEGLTYQWYYQRAGATKWTAWTGKTAAKLTFKVTDSYDGMKLYCKVTSSNGSSVDSDYATLTVGTPIVITQQPEDIMYPPGATASLSVVAEGEGLTYQWYYQRVGATKWTAWGGKISPTMTFKVTDAYDGMKLYCKVTSANGTSVDSDYATLTVGTPIIITQHPEDIMYPTGATASLSIVAEGDSLTYQWYYQRVGATKWTAWGGKTSPTMTFKVTDAYDGMKLYCKVTDGTGASLDSEYATLTVGTPVTITQQPEDIMCPTGATAVMTVAAEGEDLSYQWYYQHAGTTRWIAWSGKTAAKLTFKVSDSYDGMKLYCKVTSGNGSSKDSDYATLTVGTPIVITQQPEDIMYPTGATASLSVVAEGEDLSYQWYYQRVGATKWTAWGGKTSSTMTFKVTDSYDGMKLYCKVTSGNGMTEDSDFATLTVGTPLVITQQPEDIVYPIGATASLTVVAEGEDLTYQWYYQRVDATKWTAWSGKTSATMTFKVTSAYDGMKLYCAVTDKYGTTQDSDYATLTVGNPLVITQQPEDISFRVGTTASVSLEAEGDGLQYQWYYQREGQTKWTSWSGKTAPTLTFKVYETYDQMKLYCLITDERGTSVDSNQVTFTVETNIELDDIIYEITDGYLTVIDYIGNASSLTVPEVVNGLTVKRIGESAFEGNTTLQSIDLPDTIEVIGRRAFAGCTSLSQMN